MKTFHTFKTIKGFEKFLRGEYNPGTMSGEIDYITIGGIVYTMHEYDINGQSITWANKKHDKIIELETANRYKLGYKDAKVSEYPAFSLRTDITYYQ